MPSTIKTVLFDLDETLFDHQYSRSTATKAIHANYACFRDREFASFEQDLTVHLDELWPLIEARKMSIKARIAEGLRRLSQQYELDEVDCEGIAQVYRQTYREARQPIAGAIRLMEILKPQVKIGIITNHIEAEQRDKLQYCKLDPLVDFMVCAGEFGVSKPDRRIFEHALELAGCSVSEAVMIGDSWWADVQGAAGVGMRAVWLNRDHLPCPDPALAVEIHSLEPAEEVARLLLG